MCKTRVIHRCVEVLCCCCNAKGYIINPTLNEKEICSRCEGKGHVSMIIHELVTENYYNTLQLHTDPTVF